MSEAPERGESIVTDPANLRDTLRDIQRRVTAQPRWPVLRAAHLDLVTIVGQLQGLVGERRRVDGESAAVQEAETVLETLKTSVRQVGMDIRLASEPALAIGIETSLQQAFDVLDALDGPAAP